MDWPGSTVVPELPELPLSPQPDTRRRTAPKLNRADRMKVLSPRLGKVELRDTSWAGYMAAPNGVSRKHAGSPSLRSAQLLAAPSRIQLRIASIWSCGSGSPLYGMRA